MPNLKSTAPRPPHYERPQPTHRTRSFPLLEKRRDYRLRARDHKTKQARLKTLSEKARARNEDEFSFGMMRAETQGGKLVKRRGAHGGGEDDAGRGMSVERVKGLKAQDTAWVRNELGKVRGMIEGVRGGLRISGVDRDRGKEGVEAIGYDAPRASNRKTVFVDSLTSGGTSDLHAELETSGERKAELAVQREEALTATEASNRVRDKDAARRKVRLERMANFMERLRGRQSVLLQEEREIAEQRVRMGKSAVGVRGVNRDGLKFRVTQRAR